MTVRKPTAEQIAELADRLGLNLEVDELLSYRNLVGGMMVGFAALERMPDDLPPVRYPRAPGVRPAREENPYGAWYVKTRVEGAKQGVLAGRSVVLKDNVMLAGVSLMNGTSTLEGYVPRWTRPS